MKRILSVILAVIMLLSCFAFVGCEEKKEEGKTSFAVGQGALKKAPVQCVVGNHGADCQPQPQKAEQSGKCSDVCERPAEMQLHSRPFFPMRRYGRNYGIDGCFFSIL